MTDIRKAALELYIPPFKQIGGYIWDSANHMLGDNGGPGEQRELFVARIRGWGRIQYIDNPKGRAAALQDEVGDMVVEALNYYWTNADTLKAQQEQIKELTYKLAQEKAAHQVWLDKTEWVQKSAEGKHLGMHRADVMNEWLRDRIPKT